MTYSLLVIFSTVRLKLNPVETAFYWSYSSAAIVAVMLTVYVPISKRSDDSISRIEFLVLNEMNSGSKSVS